MQLFLVLVFLLSFVASQTNTSNCVITSGNGLQYINCVYNASSAYDGIVERHVFYSLPQGTPPPNGWPVVLLFQGSFYEAGQFFHASSDALFGGFIQVQVTKALLDNGFAVVAPNAMYGGDLFWDTNLPPWDTIIDIGLWPTAPDAKMLTDLFGKMESGQLGPLDMSKMHAGGISSGGYMSSRMAFFYAKQFRSVTIASGSFYYCSGIICSKPFPGLPGQMKSDHPPTLFLHGVKDLAVPIFTMRLYDDDMTEYKLPHKVVTCADCGHQWIPQSPQEVLAWVQKYN